MKTILLTGSGGFVGKNLKAYLAAQGYNIIAPRSAEFDFTDTATVLTLAEQTKPDIYVLCGFYGIDNPPSVPPDTIERNLKIFNNFTAAANGARIITFGSGAEFDKSRPIVKAKESDLGKVIPQETYGQAKYLISKEIEKHPNIINLRLFGVYGPHEMQHRFITYAIKQNLKRDAININQNVVFDYLYIEDLCKITEAFIERAPQNRFINMTPTQSIDLIKISQIINSVSAFKSPVNIVKQGFNNEYTGDNTVLRAELPNFKFTSYQEGIAKFYEYLKTH